VDSAAEARFVEWAASRSGSLHRLAFVLCGDWHLAEDLAQEALARTALHWQRIESVEHPDAYVRRILLNQHQSLRRRPGWRLAGRFAPPEVSVPDSTEGYANRAALLAAVQQLPPRQRAVIVLRYYEQLSEAETASAMGCSTGTVKSQSHKALQSLRRVVKEEQRC
jgi:RNA polymerase sigma-70 factor (sigma-E family)